MSTRKLLLADDSITIQKVVNLTFADEGIEVICVSNGDSAIEKMAEFSPDLVMADINMPGLTGYQVCERIKQDANFKNIPVILLVGSFEPFDEEEARRVGADDFLTKPFQSIRQLVSKVTALLDANNGNAAQIYEATANNSFADTLDMETPEITDSDQANDLGDAGMDDEMIQSTPVNSFALDESAKFETKDFASYEDSEDYKKTQPLSVYDLKDFSFVADSPEKENESQTIQTADTDESASANPTEHIDMNDSEPDYIAENKNDEPESQSQDFAAYRADESQPDTQNFYESVLEESDVNDVSNEKKENLSSFLGYSDDDFLEIPFDEDEEWEIAEEPENNSTESTEPTLAAEENEQKNAEQNQSLTGQLSAPESFEEAPVQEFYESEEITSQESGAVIPSHDFDNEFKPKPDKENVSAESDDENSSTETAENVAQAEDTQSEFVTPDDSDHSENEIVVGSLIESENNDTKFVNEEKAESPVGNQSASDAAAQFSPELIDAVARRVVEMLSDKVIREIAWEVVPQHADLVIKKAVEEKLAEEKLT